MALSAIKRAFDVTGTGLSGRLGLGQGGLGGEPRSNDLIGCLGFQHALPTGVVGGVEAAQELFELVMVGVDRDGSAAGNGLDGDAGCLTLLWQFSRFRRCCLRFAFSI